MFWQFLKKKCTEDRHGIIDSWTDWSDKMFQDYVYIGSSNSIKLATEVTEEDKGIVYMGKFLSYEEAKTYHESCTGESL